MQEQYEDRETVHNHSGELPRLKIHKTKGSAGFIQEEIYLEARGLTLKESIQAMEYLIKKQKELK